MFLNQLSGEEKKAFISFSVRLSESNGVFDESEKEMIREYCKEMEIPLFDAKEAYSEDEIVNVFRSSTDHIKRIVILEALGLAYADGQLDMEESDFMEGFAERIGVDEKTYDEVASLLEKYLMVVAEMVEKI